MANGRLLFLALHPSLLARQSASALKVGVSYKSKMANFMPVIAKEDWAKAILAVYIAAKDVLAVLHY